MTLRGAGPSFLRKLSPKMRAWVHAVCEGEDPFEATRRIYPLADNVAMRVEELFAHPKAKEGIRILTAQNIRFRLLKVIADPKADTKAVLSATKQLSKLDEPRLPEEKKKKKGFPTRPVVEEKDFEAKMRDLGEKAKVN
jgi:hypothetical protein